MSIVGLPQLPQLHHIIGGERMSGKDELPVFNPSTGGVIALQLSQPSVMSTLL